MDCFQLEKDIPGVLTSFSVSPSVVSGFFNEGKVLELNYRRLFRRVSGRKKVITSFKAPPKLNEVAELPPLEGSPPLKQPKRYESIIDKLERKYYTLSNAHLLEDDDYSNSAHSDGDDSKAESASASPLLEGIKKKSKKRKCFAIDDYDYSDPFLDDSEAMVELEQAINRKCLKTKNDGFFISSGKLEVLQTTKTSRSRDRRSQPKPSSTVHVSDDEDDEEETSMGGISMEVDGEPKKAGKKKKRELVEGDDLMLEEGTTTPLKQKRSQEEESSAKKTEKAAWVPHADVEKAMEIFKITVHEVFRTMQQEKNCAVTTSDAPSNEPSNEQTSEQVTTDEVSPEVANDATVTAISSSSTTATTSTNTVLPPKKLTQLPKPLDAPLVTLHNTVLSHHTPKELTKTTGYYEWFQSLLGAYFTPGRMKLLITKITARLKAKTLYEQYTPLVTELMQLLSAQIVPCPAYRQPNANPQKKQKNKTTAASSDDPTGITEPEPKDEPVDGEKDKDATDGTNVLPAITFQWYCKWTVVLRTKVLELEDLVEDWVTAENAYREKLTVVEKRDMTDEECELLDNKEEWTKILTKLCSIFPESCLGGDVKAVRKAMTTERARLKKLAQEQLEKEKQAKEQQGGGGLDGTEVSSVSGIPTEDTTSTTASAPVVTSATPADTTDNQQPAIPSAVTPTAKRTPRSKKTNPTTPGSSAATATTPGSAGATATTPATSKATPASKTKKKPVTTTPTPVPPPVPPVIINNSNLTPTSSKKKTPSKSSASAPTTNATAIAGGNVTSSSIAGGGEKKEKPSIPLSLLQKPKPTSSFAFKTNMIRQVLGDKYKPPPSTSSTTTTTSSSSSTATTAATKASHSASYAATVAPEKVSLPAGPKGLHDTTSPIHGIHHTMSTSKPLLPSLQHLLQTQTKPQPLSSSGVSPTLTSHSESLPTEDNHSEELTAIV